MMVPMAVNSRNPRMRPGLILLAALTASVAGNCPGEPIVFEAEHGIDVKLNYETKKAKKASGGLAVTLGEGGGGTFGYGSNTNPDIFIGEARYPFRIEEDGQYFVSARVFWMDKCGNLTRIVVDDQLRRGIGSSDSARHTFRRWYWQSSGPFHLSKGDHWLRAIAHEDGPLIDRWCIHKPDETPTDGMKENWPGRFPGSPLKPVSVSISKPSELIGEDGTHPVTLWLRKCTEGAVEGTIVVKGPKDMKVKPGTEIPVRFKAGEILKRVDLSLRFPVNTPRGEKKITVFAMDSKGMVGSVAMCILARPYDWWVLGPLPAPARAEEGLGFGARVDLREKVRCTTEEREAEARWKRLSREAFNPYQTIDLEKVFGESTDTTAYLYTEVRAGKDDRYLMLINSDGALDVWIDGTAMYSDPRHHPAAGWLRHHYLDLKKGKHRILARIQQNGAEDTDYQQNYWLFRLRLRKSRREPAAIGGLECASGSGSPPWGRRSPRQRSGRSR
jgi:hypothetical protein